METRTSGCVGTQSEWPQCPEAGGNARGPDQPRKSVGLAGATRNSLGRVNEPWVFVRSEMIQAAMIAEGLGIR